MDSQKTFRMKKLLTTKLAILITMLLVISCKSTKPLTQQFTTVVKDSIFKKVITVDTLKILRKADTAQLQVPIHQLQQTPIVQQSKTARLTLAKQNGQILAKCECPELKAALEIQKEVITHYKELNQSQKELLIQREKYIPKLVKWLAIVGGISIALILFKVFVKK